MVSCIEGSTRINFGVLLFIVSVLTCGLWYFWSREPGDLNGLSDLVRQTGLERRVCENALKGESASQYEIGNYYANVTNRYRDDLLALSWYQKAAGQGLAKAQYSLGKFYAVGRGTRRDDVMAAELYCLAATKGDLPAANSVGECYQYGVGLERDETLAVKWYKVSAEGGYADGMVNLAKCYLRGLGGLNKDISAAESLLHRAVTFGSQTALELLNDLVVKPDSP